ncbi:MAG: GC-type dockerin domain-anchored protein [Phycisphaerales bacterium]
MTHLTRFAAWSVPVLVSVGLVAPARGQAPADTCASAPSVAVPGSYSGTTATATNDGSASCGQSASTRDVWLQFTAPGSATFVASTCGLASWDTVLSIHSGCPGSAGNELVCLDDSCGQRTTVSLVVSAGQTYYLRISGFNGASGSFTVNLQYTDPPNTGPDVIVGDITSIIRWGAVGGITAYSVGTTSCNIGTEDAIWDRDTNQHPLIAQGIYRLMDGRFEQLGQSWLKHTFGTVDNGICGVCNGHLGQILGVGCSDPYSASQAGDVTLLGPKWQVNATTGAYPYPFFNNPPAPATIGRRIQAATTDINPTLNPGALYFFEAAYISTDDAPAGNGLNNYSYRPITIASATSTPVSSGPTARTRPAIKAWKDTDPAVTEVNADYVESGIASRFIVSAKVTDNGNGTWSYEYAVFNLNANRSARSFTVPTSVGASVTEPGFHDVAYHSGDGPGGVNFDGTDWTSSVSPGQVAWSTQTFAQNQSANALRWGTLYNFRFKATVPPATGDAVIELFKPGDAGDPSTVTVPGVPVPGGGACPGDWNMDGSVTSQDFFDFVAAFFSGNADFNHNGVTDSQDFFDFLAAFFGGC